MAKICTLPTSQSNPFTFIACDSVNISYDINGLASVSFTVVSTAQAINLQSYTNVAFGVSKDSRVVGGMSAGRVRFSGYISNYELNRLENTSVYEHKLTLIAFGCRE